MDEVKKEEKKMDRRKYIKYVGAGAVVAAAAAAIGYGVSELTKPPPPKPTTIVQTALKTETLPGTTIVRTEEKTVVTTVPTVTTITTALPMTSIRIRFPFDITARLTYSFAWARWYNMYQAKYPEVKTSWEVVSWPQTHAKNLADTAAGTAPEVVFDGPQYCVTWYKPKLLATPLNDFIDELSEEEKKDFLAWDYVKEQLTWGGNIIELPTQIYPRIGMFRKDIFEALGLTPLDERPPKTIEEFLSILREIKRVSKGKNPFTGGPMYPMLIYHGPLGTMSLVSWYPIVYYYNGGKNPVFSDPFGKISFNNDAVIRAYKEFWIPVVNEGLMVPEGLTDALDSTTRARFATGIAAISPLEHNGYIGIWEKAGLPPEKIGTYVPFCPTLTNSWDVLIPASVKDEDKKRAAWNFIKLGIFDHNCQYSQMLEWNPGPLPVLESVHNKLMKESPERYGRFQKTALEVLRTPGFPLLNQHVYAPELDDTIAKMSQRILVKGEPVESVVKEMEDEFNKKYFG